MSNCTLQGIDRAVADQFSALRGKSVGVLCHQASVTKTGTHLLDELILASKSQNFRIAVAFGPQHGIWGHTQDNMIEWEGYEDTRTGIPFRSLYGEHRKPRSEWLEGIDHVVIDLVDVGSRYYTFMWTMVYMLQACAEAGIAVTVLDRFNPIGRQVEGTVLQPEFASFVGLHPLPTRHGRTLGELAMHFARTLCPNLQLSIVVPQATNPHQWFEDLDLMWAMPSPNMPHPRTAAVYPGGCLLEGTNLSEGRGTTRPFEMVGASFLDPWDMGDALNSLRLPGVYFRPIMFQPTFHKFKGENCGGVFVHLTDQLTFEPVLTYVAILQEVVRQAGEALVWKQPPYEYEYEKLPIDILAGNDWLRRGIEQLDPLVQLQERMRDECADFVRMNPDY